MREQRRREDLAACGKHSPAFHCWPVSPLLWVRLPLGSSAPQGNPLWMGLGCLTPGLQSPRWGQAPPCPVQDQARTCRYQRGGGGTQKNLCMLSLWKERGMNRGCGFTPTPVRPRCPGPVPGRGHGVRVAPQVTLLSLVLGCGLPKQPSPHSVLLWKGTELWRTPPPGEPPRGVQ